MFDLLGRKKTVSLTFLFGAISTVLVPIVSPNILAYDFCRIIFTNTLVFMVTNPFINDYVKA